MAECNLAIIGCGGIAGAYATALQRMTDVRLVAVVDPEEAARQRVAELAMAGQTKASSHQEPPLQLASLQDLLAVHDVGVHDAGVHGALVLAPPSMHEELSVQLLQRGIHVLCEKPLAPTVEAAQRMLQCADSVGRRLMMGSKFRYSPDVTKARELLDEQVCGDIVIYENVFCSHVDMTQRWNSRPAISGGGVLIDNGCHSVDLARYLLGPLAKVQAQFGPRVQALEVEDTARMLFQTNSGTLGSIDLSWSIHKETDAYVRLHGTKGTLEIGWRGSRWKTSDGEWQNFGTGYDKITAFQAQLENFVAGIVADAKPVIDGTDAMASVVVVACAYQSAQEERWVTVPH
jgi:predicted dehydrogenase